MPLKEVMHGIGTQRCPAEVGKHNLAVAARRFAEPGPQHGDRRLGERYTALFATLSDHANVSTWTEYYVLACHPGHFRQPEPRLRRDQEEGVIAPTEPGVLIGRGEQGLTSGRVRKCTWVRVKRLLGMASTR